MQRGALVYKKVIYFKIKYKFVLYSKCVFRLPDCGTSRLPRLEVFRILG